MKGGDLVRYKAMCQDGTKTRIWIWEKGLLIEFDKTQRTCEILDHKTGEIIKKHCSDVQLVKVGHAHR